MFAEITARRWQLLPLRCAKRDGRVFISPALRTETRLQKRIALLHARGKHCLKMRALFFPGDDADLDVPKPAFLEELV